MPETLCGVMVNRGGTVCNLSLPELRVLVPTAQPAVCADPA